ncbi:MAG: HEAT repeat domain-containing protein [Rivularia sp. (in: cyanobacteria)]
MVKSQGFFKQPFILFPITFLLVFFLSFPGVNAQNVTKPKPQSWQINGIVAALDDDYDKVKENALSQLAEYEAKDLKPLLKKPDDVAEKVAKLFKNQSVDLQVRNSAARALGNLGDAAKPYVEEIVDILKDKSLDSEVRGSAAFALGNMGDIAKPYIKDILDLVKDKSVEANIRSSLVYALKNMGDANKPYLQDILDLIEDKSVDLNIRIAAVSTLKDMGDIAKPYIKEIIDIIKDESVNSDARTTAAFALGDMGDAAKPYIKEIFNLIKDESVDSQVRRSAASALGNMGDAAKPYIKDIANILKDKSVDSDVRSIAASALGNLGDTAKPYVKDILNLIKDKSVEPYVRSSAAYALENLGDAAKPYFKDILNLIKDKSVDSSIRSSAAQALGNIQQLNLEEIVIILDNVYYAGESSSFDPTGFDNWRFFTYFLSGGTNEVKTLLKWTGYPKKLPDKITHDEAVKTLKTFGKVWQSTQDLTRLRNDLARKIAIVAKKSSWKPQDIILLEQHYRNLKQAGYNEADTLQSVIVNLKGWQWFFTFRNIILIHAAFWLILIFAYPKSPQIQAIFFWNPWVRRIFGMGYVGFLLAWIPFLRHKLFQPFQPSLLADAGLNNFDERIYFPESGITQTQNIASPSPSKITAISQVIPNIQGQIVLEGDSGLGKSMFLRYLVKTSKRIIVYLPARKCEKGVIEAIQIKLHGQAQDAQFLKNLIYSGAIDICIDGLNEVTADTRAQIRQFVESYFRGNIIMTTQPLEWEPPSTAKTYYLQPLEKSQIQQFLYSREPHLPHDAKIKGSDYQKNCDRYLDESLNTPQTPEELTAVKRILSNPMDLTLVALMLSQGEHPNVFHLQQQQYNLMAEEYQRFWQQDFPLKQFSEAVYQMRLNDESALPDDDFYNELLCMEDEKYKMVVSRQWEDCDDEGCKEWYFRHDKIMDYFIVQTFLGDSNDAESRLIDNIGDPRFRGVYFLLATLLRLNEAKDLREKLINYAADTKDHTVSDTFVQLLRTR